MLNDDLEDLRERVREWMGVPPEDVVLLFIGGPAAHTLEGVEMLARLIMPQLSPTVHLVVAGGMGRI
jgi:hypothetical protein